MRLENNGSDFKTDFRGIPTTDSSTLLGGKFILHNIFIFNNSYLINLRFPWSKT